MDIDKILIKCFGESEICKEINKSMFKSKLLRDLFVNLKQGVDDIKYIINRQLEEDLQKEI